MDFYYFFNFSNCDSILTDKNIRLQEYNFTPIPAPFPLLELQQSSPGHQQELTIAEIKKKKKEQELTIVSMSIHFQVLVELGFRDLWLSCHRLSLTLGVRTRVLEGGAEGRVSGFCSWFSAEHRHWLVDPYTQTSSIFL